jgi:hypothetical protein
MSKVKPVVMENYRLPSLGKLYSDNFPEEVTIRSMTTFEEKMRLGSQGFWKTMCSILDAVVTSPENFDTSQMTLFDFYFLMYKMRIVSYGHIYKVTVTCPHCGKSTVCKIDLDTLEVNYLEDTDKEPFTIGPLPRSGDTLECRYLRVYDAIRNEKAAKDILRQHPDYQGDPSYIQEIASKIVTVNQEDIQPATEMYVERMSALDSAYFFQAYNSKVNRIGMTTTCQGTCEGCGEELVFDLPFNSEFFRPTFDI